MTDQQPGTDVAVRQERQWATVQNVQPLLDTHRFEHFQRAAKALMHSSILNESVRGNSPEQCFSNLMLVFDLSDRWKLPPMSIAQGIAIVHNKVVYEGKLIAAMLDASLGVRLHYWWTGERGQPDYRIYVSDKPWDDLSDKELDALRPGIQIRGRRVIDGSVGEWRTFQKDGRNPNPAWTGAATQNQLAYRGAREWARRYEPAQMLGVYGDDEIDAITLRMEARDVTPPAATGGLSAGFAKAAGPDLRSMDDVQDAEVEEIRTQLEEEKKKAAEKLQAEVAALKADAAPKAEAGEKAPKAEAGEKAKGRGKGAAKAKAATAASAVEPQIGPSPTDLELQAGRAAWTGAVDDVLESLLLECDTEEKAAAVNRGWAAGRRGLEQNLEDAYALGQSGTPTMRGDWFQEGEDHGEDADRRWQLIHAEWKRGAEALKGESEADASAEPDAVDEDTDGEGGDDALDAIREAEPDLVDQALEDEADAADDAAFDLEADQEPEAPDAIKAWIRGLESLGDWAAIKASMNALSKTSAWTEAAPERIADIRRRAWVREAALIEAGDDRMDFINDITAFRCWMETTTDLDAINGNWMTLVRQPIYANLSDDHKRALERAVLARVETIKSGKS